MISELKNESYIRTTDMLEEQKMKEAIRLELVKEMSKLSKVKHLVGEEFEKKNKR